MMGLLLTTTGMPLAPEGVVYSKGTMKLERTVHNSPVASLITDQMVKAATMTMMTTMTIFLLRLLEVVLEVALRRHPHLPRRRQLKSLNVPCLSPVLRCWRILTTSKCCTCTRAT